MVKLSRLLLGLALVGLVGCAAQPASQATLAPEPTSAATAPPVATSAPTAPPAALTPTQPTVSAATAEPPVASAPPAQEAIQMGRTPEGYQYLGSPDAPVTISFYSDFF